MLTVITGPPCSGKSTYVECHAQPGDIVIEVDQLAQTFGSPVTHGHNSRHAHVARCAWTAAIDAAIRCHGWGHTVWIVDPKPSDRRQAQYERAGARIVVLHADIDVLRARARVAQRPQVTLNAINEWAPVNPTRSRQW